MTFTPDDTLKDKRRQLQAFASDPQLAERDDLVYCMEYLRRTQLPETDRIGNRLKDRPSDYMIARDLGLTKNELNNMLAEWRRKDPTTGASVLDKMRFILYGRIAEEIQNTQLRVMGEMPAILDNIIDIAKSGRSTQSALQAAQWLWTTFVEPAKSKYEPEDTPSLTDDAMMIIDNMASEGDFNHPLSIGDTPFVPDDEDEI